MSSTKTKVIAARISNEAYGVYTKSGLSAKEWIEKMAETLENNGVTPFSGESGQKQAQTCVVDGVTPYEELGFDELLSAMRRRGYSDRKIREINSQIREQILNA